MASTHDTLSASSSKPEGAPFFSIVMPVYGVESYIMDAIADILCQTFGDFELIVVDDATPDASIAIVEELAGDDERVHIVRHSENRGLSQARNTGIVEARGSWILFPDPDDRYDADLLERLKTLIEDNPVDLLIFGHIQEYFDAAGAHLYDNPLDPGDAHYVGERAIGTACIDLEKSTHLGYAWNKVYRTDIIRGNALSFETVAFIEDILFNLAYLNSSQTLRTVSWLPYRYAKRVSSNLTNASDGRYFETHERRIRSLRDFLEARGCLDEYAKRVLGALFARFILSALERNCAPGAQMDLKARRTWLEKLYGSDLFGELIPWAAADESSLLQLCIRLMQSRNTPALLAVGRAIHIVRSQSTTLYTKARSRR